MSGADQINGAIQQLNQVIQQNAGVAEEMSSTGEMLSSQADRLLNMVSVFKVNEEAGAGVKLPVEAALELPPSDPAVCLSHARYLQFQTAGYGLGRNSYRVFHPLSE